MFKFVLPLAVFMAALAVPALAQDKSAAKPTVTIAEKSAAKPAPAPAPPSASAVKSSRGPVFRPTKEQIKEVQTMLKEKGSYSGEATGSYNDETRKAIRSFQKDNGLRQTGTLNRATLEKFGIELTEGQKAIPVSENSFAKEGEDAKAPAAEIEKKPRKAPFRASKEQIKEAQKLLKEKAMYTGEETGKLDTATREGLKKFQAANEIKVTGTLNRATLEKLGIELTEKQKTY